MKALLFITFSCISAVCLEASDVLEVSGRVDGEISIPCFGSWAANSSSEHSRMYFCREVCSRESTLIETEMKTSDVKLRGRYIMEFDKGEGVFTVTITRLRRADTGRYVCGVERSFNLLYQEVNLRVLDDATVPHGLPPSMNITLQTEEATPPQGSVPFSSESSPTAFTLSPAEKKKTQQEGTNLTDTTVVIIVSGSLAFLVCAIIPLIFYRHWRSNEGQDRPAGNKAEGEENANMESSQVAVGLQSMELEAHPEPSPDDNFQYAACYEALDPQTLD
ncbi:CMRF35-like molecule 3 [Melanotaenia boesemani]|uniref:CMRF35-like molecule 3 n=1 Tax=Melanotaenia boesemani TaxID=1250792 RepID=UPI001C0441B1|nr:CMRF35-like molecule 3 [Melanotaenia boesemani]